MSSMVTDHSFEGEYITAAVDDHHQGRQTDSACIMFVWESLMLA